MSATVQARAFEELAKEKIPYISELERYFQVLGEKMMQVYKKFYSESIRYSMRERYGSIVDGVDLVRFDPIKAPADLGIKVEMKSREVAVRNRALDSLTPYLQIFQQEVFNNEQIISLTGLRDAKVPLPNDNQRRKTMQDIYDIVYGDFELDNADYLALEANPPVDEMGQPLPIEVPQDVQTVRDMVMQGIEKHAIAIDFIDKFLIDNAKFLQSQTDPTQLILLRELRNTHQKALDAQMQQQMMQMQQAQAQQQPPVQ
jgi:hypothetical protein